MLDTLERIDVKKCPLCKEKYWVETHCIIQFVPDFPLTPVKNRKVDIYVYAEGDAALESITHCVKCGTRLDFE